jgi:protein-L-isoaspartate(D-aspartate) O-methyltransferase
MGDQFIKRRKNMLEGQIKPHGVTDQRLIEALLSVPREVFLPKHLHSLAYADDAVDLLPGRSMLNPVDFSRMVQAADISKEDIVLDVGCLTGYSTAVISYLCNIVIGLDCHQAFIADAQKHMQACGVTNSIFVHQADLAAGYARQAPYQVIVINQVVSRVPQAFADQLDEGGRLVAVVSSEPRASLGRATLFRKSADLLTSVRVLFDCGVSNGHLFAEKQRFAL